MAKVPFSKLQASINISETKISYINKSGEEIIYEVKNILPFKEKIELITRIINLAVDDNGFYNPMRVKLYLVLETVYAYSNLSFTEKMKEDAFKLYDILTSTGIFTNIVNAIDINEWKTIQEDVLTTIENIYKYRNSAMGIFETVTNDYSNLNYDAKELQSALANPENMALLKDVLTKLG